MLESRPGAGVRLGRPPRGGRPRPHPGLSASSADRRPRAALVGWEILTRLLLSLLSLPKQLLHSTSSIANHAAAARLFYFLFWSGLKRGAAQQAGLLPGLLSLRRHGAQLNIMEAGSWFAVWAIWRRISFFVMIPRRRLKRINRRLPLKLKGKEKRR